ncbi:hypothetical protein QA645_00795 [Bradyrhizobium sp. CIAT3101]|uniref:hypothetical protein n=1 Tax=Bradyrhizobium sp. CIAT3101 TaxID=439387 RepID=UPI0024B20B71|nr:hypothetical protein [Bradyrhizobium sp. CIAT3101]WFU81322.1 hypothetical protein QA645_00795 [Bradyrhizobium sp. CIAT3101]
MPKKRIRKAGTSDLSRAAKKWHKEVTRYLERRMNVAEDREDDIEMSYLYTCQLALAICEQLGIGLEQPDLGVMTPSSHA